MTVLADLLADRHIEAAYELSSRGPLVAFLERHVAQLTRSEFYDDVRPGDRRDEVRCEDVRHLTFADGAFDLCTSTEVFEHVPDDRQGFREVRRVLRAGSLCVFTVPLTDAAATTERARVIDGQVVHLLPPEYHGDRIRRRVLAFRNYGLDITDRLRACGFAEATVDWRYRDAFLGYGSGVVIARA